MSEEIKLLTTELNALQNGYACMPSQTFYRQVTGYLVFSPSEHMTLRKVGHIDVFFLAADDGWRDISATRMPDCTLIGDRFMTLHTPIVLPQVPYKVVMRNWLGIRLCRLWVMSCS